jgi:hypothetical protein
MISKQQGIDILVAAAQSGEWVYSMGQKGEPTPNSAARIGDCVAYCLNAAKEGAFAGGAKRATWQIRGGDHPGFTEVEFPQAGDMVVQGGHAGVLLAINPKNGDVWALANNGCPTSCTGGYKDGKTAPRKFNSGTYGPGAPQFFRPLKKPMR